MPGRHSRENDPLNTENAVDWRTVRKVLVIRLRSIGDTVLATPTIRALRDFLPDARIDVLLEDWVAPLLEGHPALDSVVPIPRNNSRRMSAAMNLRMQRYDVVLNLHGGTTSTFLTRATGARYKVGFSGYQYSFLYDLRLKSAREFWESPEVHSAEQQLAVAGLVGVPVRHRPASELPDSPEARSKIDEILNDLKRDTQTDRLALLHPAAALFTKQWDTGLFARAAEHLESRGFLPVAVGSAADRAVLGELSTLSAARVATLDDLSLPEITALARRASLFVGNDSGIAHIAAAVDTPPVVIFGSSNRIHWRPWTEGPSRMVFRKFDCQPCPGYECRAFGSPRCILEVPFEAVRDAIDDLVSGTRDLIRSPL